MQRKMKTAISYTIITIILTALALVILIPVVWIVFAAAEILFVIFTARIAGRAYDESRARVKEYYVTLMELEELYEKEGEEETL